jgi:hypothetical protein
MRRLALLVFGFLALLGAAGAEAQTNEQPLPTPFCISEVTTGSQNSVTISLANKCSYTVGVYRCVNGSNANLPPCMLTGTSIAGGTTAIQAQGQASNSALAFDECPAAFAASSSGSSQGTPPACTPVTTSTIEGAVLPNAIAAEIGDAVAASATIVNTSNSAVGNCVVTLPDPIAKQFSAFSFQASGEPVNTPVNIAAGGSANFALSFTGATAGRFPNQQLVYGCNNGLPAISTEGISSIDITFTSGPTANILAEAATPSGNGILSVPLNGSAAFGVSTDNTGNEGETVTVSVDTGGASLPLKLSLCQTNAKAACLASPSSTVSTSIGVGQEPTFSVFVTSTGSVSLNAATNRVFIRFKDGNGNEVGATSVAVET